MRGKEGGVGVPVPMAGLAVLGGEGVGKRASEGRNFGSVSGREVREGRSRRREEELDRRDQPEGIDADAM